MAAAMPPGNDGHGEYAEVAELQNILNLAMAVKDDSDEYFVVAAWLESHDLLIKELLSSPDVYITPRKRYTSTGRIGSVHFTADDGGRVFVCITKEGYPSRVAHMCLEEMQDHILLSPHNSASLVATRPHELSDAMLGILDDLVDKFDDPAQADALTSVNRKIDVTTNVMQENISLLLENDAKIEEIEGKSEHMSSAADKFKSTSVDLRKKMWWKLCKMRMCYAFVVVAVLAVIIIPLSVMGSAEPKKGGKKGHGGKDVDQRDGSEHNTEFIHSHDDEYWQATHSAESGAGGGRGRFGGRKKGRGGKKKRKGKKGDGE